MNDFLSVEDNLITEKNDYSNVKFESNVDFITSLKNLNFEGPLDLLLYLVKEARIEIKQIFVSQVTEQYLKYVEQLDDVDMEKIAEYLNIAATLVEIKSRSILPPVEEDFGPDFESGFDDYVEDPERTFIRRLEEYKLLKEAGQKLKEQETTEMFYKEPEPAASDVKVVYKDFTLDGLVNAFSKLLARVGGNPLKKNDAKSIPKEVFTVAGKINHIRTTLVEREECNFTELFHEEASVTEIITTFQALLELLKMQYLRAEQDETYSDIKIFLREDRSEDIGEIDEYN